MATCFSFFLLHRLSIIISNFLFVFQVFSTTDKYGKPYEFVAGVGNIVVGWDEGVMHMRLGEKATLTITGKYA